MSAGDKQGEQPIDPKQFRYVHYVEEDLRLGGGLVRMGSEPATPAGKDILEACARSMGGFVMLEPRRS